MRCFPQLATGAIAQFPIKKRLIQRTVLERTEGGAEVKWPDVSAAKVMWELTFAGMSDAERQSLEAFFAEMEGRLNSFVFLDPTQNLLKWSEALTTPVWQRDPFVNVTQYVDDPNGGKRASIVQNAGPTSARIQQSLDVPDNFRYAFSAHVRAGSPSLVRLIAAGSGGELSAQFQAGTEWRRVTLSGQPGGVGGSVRFGVELGPGDAIQIFGLQAEPQPNASTYKRSMSKGGVYESARFLDDSLDLCATGPNEHSGTVRLISAAD